MLFIHSILLFIFGVCTPAPEVKYSFAEISFDHDMHNFGVIIEGGILSHNFIFTNTGDAPLIIQKVEPPCGCMATSYTKEPVKPNGTGIVTITYYSKGRNGIFFKGIEVRSNARNNPVELHVKGVVEKPQKKGKK